MALGSTHSASDTNEYQEIFLGGKGRPALTVDNVTAFREPIV
jgi:hypothetical protein